MNWWCCSADYDKHEKTCKNYIEAIPKEFNLKQQLEQMLTTYDQKLAHLKTEKTDFEEQQKLLTDQELAYSRAFYVGAIGFLAGQIAAIDNQQANIKAILGNGKD